MSEIKDIGVRYAAKTVFVDRKKLWEWAVKNTEFMANCYGERRLKYVSIDRLKEYLGV